MTILKGLIRNIAWLLHPRLPWPLAKRLLARRTKAALQSPYRRAVALEQMTYLLSDVASPEEIEAAAERYIEFSLYEDELRWHPRRSVRHRVEGGEHLLAAKAEGRGVILHFAHHAFYSGTFAAIRRATGVETHALVRHGALGWNVGPSLRQHMLVVRRGGALLYAGLGSNGVTERLAQGDVVAMASDAPGSSVVSFLGHDVKCSSGAVWTAREANTPIITVDGWRDEDGKDVIRLSPPVYPADHDPKELLQLLVSRHEEAILAWPEATFAPTLTWPRVKPPTDAAGIRETSMIVPKPFAKALVHNIMWLLHPRLPWPIAQRLLARRTAKALQSPAHDALAQEQMAHLLERVAPERIDEAKTEFIEFMLKEAEIRWHPSRAIDQRVEGIENLRAAQALGRGVLVSFTHHGHYCGMFGAFKREGIEHVVVVRAGAMGWNAGPGQRQHFMVFKRGGPMIDVREGTKGLIERMGRNETVMLATDVPGTSTVTFAGRRVKCSSGIVWAAQVHNSPIVVLDPWRTEDGGHVLRFSPPLLPQDFATPQDLLQEIVTQHEEAILAWPGASLMPTMSWVSAEA
jgi:lauroyl/myristoyl acyltransferase